MEKVIKEMWDKKATGDNDVPEDVRMLLGEDAVRLLRMLISDKYVTGEWPNDFTKVEVIVSKKKPKLRNSVTNVQSAL